ncbi:MULTISPECIES: LysR family transcriptional regulator [Pseudomonas]|jgi:DNA-binding transcriptional LysR family regulator|uniref:LysR family transcriptional regulator n=2 Tax=Pseudomonas TaxID=286 RepID=A0A1L7NCW7_PSEPU|nr:MULTISPECIES: LysR family transcriptional regulator [Pseudomonas]ERT17913.1 LysR family transcriptional regulator [Pseudomonas putida SJ3]PTC00266.1 LysR family transcriptional regulator [Thalassospira xiamenensis]AGN82155.1 LysR family transcriptional regulator [Pseudomonas putida H8234]EKT4449207.1 LysR family transcriptional regulator [Pseudomonas putida]MBH3470641.1 LysR family transcriptional regulator [Pseudomonas putida]
MELRHLRAFVCAATFQHFSKAAEQLEIAQPALSQLIKTLESELGVALFRRANRGVELTAAGAAFLPHAKDALYSSDLAVAAARRARRGEIGEITIGYHSALLEANLPQLMRHYFGAYPEVKVTLLDARIQAQFDLLLEGKIDIGFARIFKDHLPDRLRTHCFSLSRLVLLTPDNHALARDFNGDLASLRQEKFIFLEDPAGIGLTSHILQLCRQYQLHPANIMYVPSLMSIPGLIAAGIGISILPETLTQLSMPGIRTLQLKQPDMQSELSLITRVDERSRAVMHFLEEAGNWLK